jgi:DNA-binding beta-propeller fold protein YncE
MKKTISLPGITAILSIGICATFASAQTAAYKISGKIIIGGESRWDYLSVDETFHRLFVSHNTKVHVIDLSRDSVIGEIGGLNGVHGIAFAPEFNRGFITSGRDSAVVVFDLKSLAKISEITIDAKNPDAICYDPYTKRIFCINHTGGSATAIDAATGKVLATVATGGTGEYAVSDARGRLYVNLEDQSEVCVIDTKALKVAAKWNLAPCESPSGMAIDAENDRLFTTGHNQMMAVLNLTSGKVITTLPIGTGVDGCGFDSGTGLAFSSNGSGTITIIKQHSPDNYSVVQNVETVKGARTMALDAITHTIYTSAMLDNPDGNRKSFGVLVLTYEKK